MARRSLGLIGLVMLAALVKPGTAMPDLNLSATEIESLVVFLNEPRQQ